MFLHGPFLKVQRWSKAGLHLIRGEAFETWRAATRPEPELGLLVFTPMKEVRPTKPSVLKFASDSKTVLYLAVTVALANIENEIKPIKGKPCRIRRQKSW